MFVFSNSICSLTGSNDLRMTMTNMRDVVVSIEIAPALVVVEILHRPRTMFSGFSYAILRFPPSSRSSRFKQIFDPCIHP